MSKKAITIILIISVAINLVAIFTIGYNWSKVRYYRRDISPMWIDKGHDFGRSILRHKLDLTEDQIDVLNTRHEEMRPKMLSIREELFSKRKELLTLLREPEPNRAKADSIIRDIVSMQIGMEKEVFEHLCQIKDVFTPEQQERFSTLFEQRLLHPGGMHRPPR